MSETQDFHASANESEETESVSSENSRVKVCDEAGEQPANDRKSSQRESASETLSTSQISSKAESEAEAEPEKREEDDDERKTQPPTTPIPAPPPPSARTERPGECNLLPVLVERLRTALEAKERRIEAEAGTPADANPARAICWQPSVAPTAIVAAAASPSSFSSPTVSPAETSMTESAANPRLDSQFLEELLLADIQTALATLQDTLRNVDPGTLTRYSSTLNPTDKLHLLGLVSNLLAKLNLPDTQTCPAKPRRKRTERHTIGVSSEEIARARRCFERNNSGTETSEAEVEDSHRGPPPPPPPPATTTFHQVPKCMKDAINNHQQLKETKQKEKIKVNPEGLDSFYPMASNKGPNNNNSNNNSGSGNKYLLKKSRIKRANTIDIPNYLKLQSENLQQKGCVALRRPIAIGDKVFAGDQRTIIPSFQAKTENDRKFLALIHRNNNDNVQPSPSSFPGRHPGNLTDRNWSSRFSNIKTTFSAKEEEEDQSRVPWKKSPVVRKEEPPARSNNNNVVVGALKLPGFIHAPTSPFQKIERTVQSKNENPPDVPRNWIPSKGGSSLRAKVKMFDQGQPEFAMENKPTINVFGQKTLSANRFPLMGNSVQNVAVQTPGRMFPPGQSWKDRDKEKERDRERTPWKSSYPGQLWKDKDKEKEKLPERSLAKPLYLGHEPHHPQEHWKPENLDNKDLVLPEDHPNPEPTFLEDGNIANQDIGPLGVVTRYTSAIATVASDPSPQEDPLTEVQRHNLLQQNLIRQLQGDRSPIEFSDLGYPEPPRAPESLYREIQGFPPRDPDPAVVYPQKRFQVIPEPPRVGLGGTVVFQQETPANCKPIPSFQVSGCPGGLIQPPPVPVRRPEECRREKFSEKFLADKFLRRHSQDSPPPNRVNALKQAFEQPPQPEIEQNNTQEKINIFEGIRNTSSSYTSSPRKPKVNVVTPSKVQTQTVDSSDEYLMSCANHASRLVLSKSESWHQLALGRGPGLQLPQGSSSASRLLKPPKPRSPSSMKLSKQYEAPSNADSVKKMEEKIQRYFSPGGQQPQQPQDSTRRRSLKKTNLSLARSQTMPHLCDEKLLEVPTPTPTTVVDVERAFDHLFEESTRADLYF